MDELEKLIAAAEQHGIDSGEPDHEVGDLQDMLRTAWARLDEDERRTFVALHAELLEWSHGND